MKHLFFYCIAFSVFGSMTLFSQTKSNIEIYQEANTLLQKDKVEDAYKLYKELYSKVSEKDTLKSYVTWYYLNTSTALEKENGMNQKFDKSLDYSLESLKLIQENKKYFDEKFAQREPWMIKNVILSYSGLNNLTKAKEYKSVLYKLYKENKLPEGIDEYFNFDFFKLGDKNIWGYEWYPELPENRSSSSFTKVVYYIYNTNSDGSDKDQLYRFHVLMYHQDPKNAKFDYILERQIETDDATVSGSYYQYTYQKEIDYKKLRNDIIEIVSQNIEPSSKRIMPKRK
ncbi:hypothetical protein [Chryseobacterium polytrichastri]|uniref:Uncharacterized protein n=1 Tax=Chryseobacterium polytrichastri TaxID=1302687 RepID=A0A1M6R834_9FLAO|nr:hypothetical protein [Chryseobacterium polytrichastri]SHK28613.1 hypothetical protein SAMN05444267_1002206 [Chryseobacterium polytrichastri]